MVTCEEMRLAEEALFAEGVAAEPLMEKAGLGCARRIIDLFPEPASALLFVGKGNNGGDALVIGRLLRELGWKVEARFSHDESEMSPLARQKKHEWEAVVEQDTRWNANRLIVLDGLLGIGAKGSLRGKVRLLADELNDLRERKKAWCFAIDIPSGIDGDTGEVYEGAVVADQTLSICQPKKGIAADTAVSHTGRIAEVALPEIPIAPTGQSQLLFASNIAPRFRRRPFSMHKGQAGRVFLVAGSKGLTGAAVLNALGASRAGAGLVTLLVPEEIYKVVASAGPPEVMVQTQEKWQPTSEGVLAIGSGMGPEISGKWLDTILNWKGGLVIDADMLNAIAGKDKFGWNFESDQVLMTPHPGELRRLFSQEELEGEKAEAAMALAVRTGTTLLWKGSRSVVATEGQRVEINTTGHSGMASGGMGDVLTGMCAAFAAQGMSMHDAACSGSWILGRAAEIASQFPLAALEGISAEQVAEAIPAAMSEVR